MSSIFCDNTHNKLSEKSSSVIDSRIFKFESATKDLKLNNLNIVHRKITVTSLVLRLMPAASSRETKSDKFNSFQMKCTSD